MDILSLAPGDLILFAPLIPDGLRLGLVMCTHLTNEDIQRNNEHVCVSCYGGLIGVGCNGAWSIWKNLVGGIVFGRLNSQNPLSIDLEISINAAVRNAFPMTEHPTRTSARADSLF